MNSNEILKQIDNLIETNEIHFIKNGLKNNYDYLSLKMFYKHVKEIMKNYEKVLEIEHFKQTEL